MRPSQKGTTLSTGEAVLLSNILGNEHPLSCRVNTTVMVWAGSILGREYVESVNDGTLPFNLRRSVLITNAAACSTDDNPEPITVFFSDAELDFIREEVDSYASHIAAYTGNVEGLVDVVSERLERAGMSSDYIAAWREMDSDELDSMMFHAQLEMIAVSHGMVTAIDAYRA